MQSGVMLGGIAGDDLGIDAIGLASCAQALGVEVHVTSVEHVNGSAGLMSQARQQQVVLAGGPHGDGRSRRQFMQPALDRGRLVVQAQMHGRASSADHQRRLGHIHSDKHGIRLHRHLRESDNRDAGVERPLPRSLASRSAVDAAKLVAAQFLIDAGRRGGRTLGKSVRLQPGRQRSVSLHPSPQNIQAQRGISTRRGDEIPRSFAMSSE